jgi:glycosyltransferase involved in cell wall biosynthesis
MAQARTPVKLKIAGVADAPEYERLLNDLIQKHDLSGRVELLSHWISEEEKMQLLADCLAVLYAPYDEDSYGYPSLEAHHSSKSVITAEDSGGTLELIEDGRNGFVVPPRAEDLGRAMDRLWLDRSLAERMGQRGRQRVDDLGISWEHVIDRLLA